MTGSPRRAVHSDAAPAAIGPYSQAVQAGDVVYTAGQTPLDPATGDLVAGDVAAQTRQVLANLAAVLAAAGLGFGHVVRATVYLVDMDDFGAMNEVYGQAFEAPYPARTTVAVAALPKGARVEIDLVAQG